MKRNLLLVSAMMIATLASCTKDSVLDQTVVSAMNSQSEMTFSSYASSAATSKGTAVTSNALFQSTQESFKVAALIGDAEFSSITYDEHNNISGYVAELTEGSAVNYFGLTDVNYKDGAWTNSSKMYWPNYSKILFFAAYAPSEAAISNYSFTEITDVEHHETCTLSFDYTVTDVIGDQKDLMYAMKEVGYIAPSDRKKSTGGDSYITTGAVETNDEASVNLHFKHALTQIAFTAIKDSAIDVYVKSITICNVHNSGSFTTTSFTDDSDTSNGVDSDTVGDTYEAGDLVNADNFGSWTTYFDAQDGWNSTNTYIASTSETLGNSYYAVVGSGGHTSMSNYAAGLVELTTEVTPNKKDAIKIGVSTTDATTLTSDEALILMPQALQPWVPTSSTTLNYIGYGSDLQNLTEEVGADTDEDDNYIAGTGEESSSTEGNSLTYLAIECEIYHVGATDYGAKIHDGYIFVPFSTEGIDYSGASVDTTSAYTESIEDCDAWLPGYKITYCLYFGGGYTVEQKFDENGDLIPTTIPEPGCVPDTETYTLRTITYTTTVDNYVSLSADTDLYNYNNETDSAESAIPTVE